MSIPQVKIEMSGHITLSRGKSVDGMQVTNEFDNIILDIGLINNGLIPLDTLTNICRVGSGSSTPTATQTSLDSETRSSTEAGVAASTTANNDDPLNPYVSFKRTIRFNPSGSNYNVSEVAFGTQTTGAPLSSALYNRALVLDAGGSPVTLSIQGDEYLDVSYEVRHYVPVVDFTGAASITGGDGVPRTWTARAAGTTGLLQIDAQSGWGSGGMLSPHGFGWDRSYTTGIGDLFKEPAGAAFSQGNQYPEQIAGTPSGLLNYKIGLSAGNGGAGHKSFVFKTHACRWQIEFSEPFVKTADEEITVSVKLSWGRR